MVDCVTIFDAFIALDRPTRKATLANISIPINATKRALFFAMMILGDAIVVLRLVPWWKFQITASSDLPMLGCLGKNLVACCPAYHLFAH